MASRKSKNQDLFKLVYGVENTFWKPLYALNKFSISDYEVVNYPIIRGAWLQRQAMLLSGEIILQGDENSEAYQTVKNFLENYDDKFLNLIAYLQEAVLWGVIAVEVVWDENLLLPIRYSPIPRGFISVEEGELAINGVKYSELPNGKIIYAQNTPTADQPYGFALISILKPLYAVVKDIYNYWGNYIRTFAFPSIVFKLDASIYQALTPEERAKLDASLEHLKNLSTIKNLIITKDILDFQTIEPSSANPENFRGLLDEIHRQIVIAILGQELTTTAQTSSYALGKVHYEVLKHIVKRDAKLVENAINEQLIPAILDVKGIKTDAYPYISIQFPEKLTLDDVIKLAQLIPLSLDDIRRLTGLNL